ncbi:MAG: class I SAM-dependent methyltransferase, partial [Ktedonobacteraceae bacterium]|nr:class I SAM-dependent methyltransferase [Ktedonobacteraceae bacterium]
MEERTPLDEIELTPDPLERLQQEIAAALGGLVHHSIPLHEVSTALDIGSTGGIWAVSMVKRYQHISVTSIDARPERVHRALMRARWQQASHLYIHHMKDSQSLASGTFDLVHMCSQGFLEPREWDALIAEMARLAGQGGWLHLIGIIPGKSSSPAYNQLIEMIERACSPERLEGAIYLYKHFLAAGLKSVTYSIHALDMGCCKQPAVPREAVFELLSLARPQVSAIFAPGLYDRLLQQARHELQQPYACGYAYLISIAGQ